MITFSLPMIPNGVSWWVVSSVDRVIISNVLGTAANGIYAVSSKFSLLFSGLYDIFNISWMEAAALHIDSDDRNKFFSSTFNTILKIFGSCLILIGSYR
jgi:O-antigen/teichoic acid export membrane protein